MKKLEDAPAERNSDATKEQRFEYCQWLMGNIQRFDLIFVDEAGINLWLKGPEAGLGEVKELSELYRVVVVTTWPWHSPWVPEQV